MSPVEPSARTVNSSSTQPAMPRLRVEAGNFGARIQALQRIRTHDGGALRGASRAAAELACAAFELAAGEADGARLEQPGVGRGEIVARERAAQLLR